jgi:hypothetical protein
MPRVDPKSKLGLFMNHVIPGVARPLRVLWNEVFGLIFILIAVPMGFRAYSAFRDGDAHRLMIMGPFGAMFLYFGVSSFLRARKISRS